MQKEVNWLLKEKYNNKPSEKFYKDVDRLKAGEPIDYVIGFTEFLGCKIDLSKKPLIPRSETGYWVEKAIEEFKNRKSIKILDIFAGSGCIGLAVLKDIKNSKVCFSEKDNKLVEQIKINCKINKINPKKYKIFKSDIFGGVKGKYDYIFANPPYIAKVKINLIQKSVLQFEPRLALFGGADGLFYIKKFLNKAKNYLNPGGAIFMEFSPEQKREIEKIIKKNKYSGSNFYKDQYSRWRWVKIS